MPLHSLLSSRAPRFRVAIVAALACGSVLALGLSQASPAHAVPSTAPATYSQTATIRVPYPGSDSLISAIAIDSTTGRVYVPQTGSVLVIDESTDAVVDTIPYPTNAPWAGMIAIDTVTHTLYLYNGTGTLYAVDAATHAVATLSLPSTQMGAIAVNSATHMVYLSAKSPRGVIVVDGTSNTVVTTISGGGGGDIGVDYVTNRIYVMDALSVSSAALDVIDGSTNAVITTVPFAAGATVSPIAVDSVNNLVFVSPMTRTSGVPVLDGRTNQLVGTLSVDATGANIALDESNGRLFLGTTGGLADSVAVLDSTTGALVSADTIGETRVVQQIAVDSTTHKAYATVPTGNGHYIIDVISPVARPTVPVYRFYSPQLQDHFYTTDLAERDHIIATYPTRVWTYEGVAYNAFAAPVAGTVPLFRFWSPQLQGHFYTADANEYAEILRDYPASTWTYEGIADYVYPATRVTTDSMPVYRFWSPQFGKHFYTADANEAAGIRRDYRPFTWTYENVNFAVPVQ